MDVYALVRLQPGTYTFDAAGQVTGLMQAGEVAFLDGANNPLFTGPLGSLGGVVNLGVTLDLGYDLDQSVAWAATITQWMVSEGLTGAPGWVLKGIRFPHEMARPGELAPFSSSGTLTTGTGKGRFLFPFNALLLGVSAAVGTAPTGAAIILDLNKNGTTVFTTQGNRPQIAAGANATASEAVPDVFVVATNEYLTVDRDQVGSTQAGADLTVFVRYRRI